MYQDYKGFVHADSNQHSNGSGYSSLENFVKEKLEDLNYSKFIGINTNINENGEFISYAVVMDDQDRIVKHQLQGVKEEIFREAFNGISMMLYDNNVKPIETLEEVYILETIPINS